MTRVLFNVLRGVLIFILIQVFHLVVCLCAAAACHSFEDGSDTNLNSLGIAFFSKQSTRDQKLVFEK